MTEKFEANSLIEKLLPTLLEAGRAVMDVFHSDFSVFEKSDDSPVTEADKRGEIIITKALNALTPDIPVVGEEAKDEGKTPDLSGGRFWLVDPLDGTKEFIKRGNDFTVNIGLIDQGKPVLGLVLAPAKGRLWAGAANEGAFSADTDLEAITNRNEIKVRSAENPLTIVASKSHRSEELEQWLNHYPDANHVSIGSSLKIVLIAEGEADIYPRLGLTCEWDTAAAHAILVAAGGRIDTPEGTPLGYGKNLTTFLNSYFLAVGDQSLNVPKIEQNS